MDKLYNAIMGLVVGDALGVPFEFRKRDTFIASGMMGNGTHHQIAGTWSDDSSMTLATLESIVRLGRIDPADIMENFVRWFRDAEFTPWGNVFDVGSGTQRALARFMAGNPLSECGGRTRMDNGNGALMRILPLAFFQHKSSDVYAVCALTHNTIVSKAACGIYLDVAERLIAGAQKDTVVVDACIGSLPPEFDRLPHIGELTRDKIKSSGYVVDTLEAALWCFLTTHSYRECVLTAVNLGEDTDTVAAVAGGLAGLYYGLHPADGIPQNWIDNIARKSWIAGLCEKAQIES